MKFGAVAVAEAESAVLAHSLRVGRTMFKKGRVLTGADLATLAEAGFATVTVARLEPSDIGENQAARRIADALCGESLVVEPAESGRVNLAATEAGLVQFDAAAIDALNRVTEDVTLATIPNLAPVSAGERVATVKIIPFAVPEYALGRCLRAAEAARRTLRPFRSVRGRLIQTIH